MRILVTAGPTREYFDSVRFISNASSGRMGFGVATEAARRGHGVTLVAGPVELPDPNGVDVIHVVSAEQMFEACTLRFVECDAAVMAAAVCDDRPVRRLGRKRKRQNSARAVELRSTEDICAHLGRIKGERILVGFAMEDHNHRKNAEIKLRRKRCDAIVLNRLDALGADTAQVEILRADTGWSGRFSGSKTRIAVAIVDLVESLAGQPI